MVYLKPSRGNWCKHCKPGQGCGIYDNRPKICKEFECGWLANDGDEVFRPDNVHMIITGESQRLDAYIVHVDPAYPSALDSKVAQRLLNGLTKGGRHPNVVLVMGDKRRFIGDERKIAAAFEKAERDFERGELKILD